MKLLLILLLHPSHIVQSRDKVPALLAHLAVLGYAVMCGTAFQYLYPRLLNNVPWLGFLRRLSPANWDPVFNEDLFLRGAAMGLIIFTSCFLGYWLLGLVGAAKGKTLGNCYLAALATCMPMLVTCAGGFFFHYLHDALGLLPAYGLFATTCLQALLLRDLFKVPRAVIVYLVPSVLTVQLYGCHLLMP